MASPNNLFITFANQRGDCTFMGGRCVAGDDLTFTITPFAFNLSCSAFTVRWDFGDGSAASGQNVTHRFAAPGKYSVVATYTNSFQSVALINVVEIVEGNVRQRVARKSSLPSQPTLDEQTLRSVILEYGPIDMRPGDSRFVHLLQPQCCVYFGPVYTDVRFSIDPVSFASITADGFLSISSNAPGNVSFRIYADIENGRRIVSNDVNVDTPESNPLRGSWQAVAEIPCDGSADVPVTGPPALVNIHGGNRFEVVWLPFETYKDYWGLYTFDRTSQKATFGILAGNFLPPNVRGEGSWEITNDGGKRTLRLKNIWLGRMRGDTRPAACGMVLQ